MNVSRTVCGFVLVKLYKHLVFNNTHLLDLLSLDVSPRGVFRTLSNIKDAPSNIKTLHFRYLRGDLRYLDIYEHVYVIYDINSVFAF